MMKTGFKMRYALVMAAGLAFSASAALAITPEEVVAELQAQGYTRVEVKIFASEMKVEAIKGTDKLEVIYDRATGAILKTEVETVDPTEDLTPGIEIRDRSGDRSASYDDDDSNDDDDHSGSDDDDDSSDDHGSDDHDDDDHGSDDHDDDDHDDDHGGNSGHGGSDDD